MSRWGEDIHLFHYIICLLLLLIHSLVVGCYVRSFFVGIPNPLPPDATEYSDTLILKKKGDNESNEILITYTFVSDLELRLTEKHKHIPQST